MLAESTGGDRHIILVSAESLILFSMDEAFNRFTMTAGISKLTTLY